MTDGEVNELKPGLYRLHIGDAVLNAAVGADMQGGRWFVFSDTCPRAGEPILYGSNWQTISRAEPIALDPASPIDSAGYRHLIGRLEQQRRSCNEEIIDTLVCSDDGRWAGEARDLALQVRLYDLLLNEFTTELAVLDRKME